MSPSTLGVLLLVAVVVLAEMKLHRAEKKANRPSLARTRKA